MTDVPDFLRPTPDPPPAELRLEHLLARLASGMGEGAAHVDPDSREFLDDTWSQAERGLLSKTKLLRVERGPAPNVFRFELDRPFKTRGDDGLVHLAPGPIRGTIHYGTDLFRLDAARPSIFVDREHRLVHPNYSFLHGALCAGDLPRGAFPLEALLEHLYGVLSYADCNPADPADLAAADYFRHDPEARRGLEPVQPLY